MTLLYLRHIYVCLRLDNTKRTHAACSAIERKNAPERETRGVVKDSRSVVCLHALTAAKPTTHTIRHSISHTRGLVVGMVASRGAIHGDIQPVSSQASICCWHSWFTPACSHTRREPTTHPPDAGKEQSWPLSRRRMWSRATASTPGFRYVLPLMLSKLGRREGALCVCLLVHLFGPSPHAKRMCCLGLRRG